MSEPVIDPEVLLLQLRERHVHFISEVESRILAAIHQGYTNDEIAALLEVTLATVRRHIADLCHRVFDLTEIAPQREKLRSWTPEHFPCCTRAAHEMIENARHID